MYKWNNIRGCKRLALLCALVPLLSLFLAFPAAANTVLTSPAGGESWTVGSTHNITWTPIPEIFTEMTLDLDFSPDSGVTWTSIATDFEISEGQYAWKVPNTPTTKAKIRITVFVKDTIKNTTSTTEELSGDFTIKSSSILTPHIPYNPNLPLALPPAAPGNLSASASSSSKIVLSWEDKSNNESGFKIERKSSGDFEQIATVAADIESFQDLNLDAATSYAYRIRAYNAFGDSSYTNEATAKTDSISIITPQIPPSIPPTLPALGTEMRFYIGSSDYYVGDEIKTMDTVPQILESRTVLPLRYVAQPLGAAVDWNADEQKVNVALGSKTIILFIDNNIAVVDGVPKAVDPDNKNVKPVIMPPGRTMLPLRFIAEELGCKVDWNPSTQEIKITYPKEI
ncbi:MAG: hypothetical protein HPY50_07230 [Firmicutes bacterium]|nr:hypothetical protein [Bacillota bacterium]